MSCHTQDKRTSQLLRLRVIDLGRAGCFFSAHNIGNQQAVKLDGALQNVISPRREVVGHGGVNEATISGGSKGSGVPQRSF